MIFVIINQHKNSRDENLLNRIWSGFFFVAFISAIVQWLVFDQVLIFEEMVKAIFDMSRVTVEIAIGSDWHLKLLVRYDENS